MHKTFLEFNDRAIASGIQNGAPALAGQLKSTAERLSELAKTSTEESDIEEDENEDDPSRSVQPVAAEPRSRWQGRESGPAPVSMLGYQTTFGEEEDEEEDDAGEIAAPPAQFELDNNLPQSDWTGTESMQQLRSDGPQRNTQSFNNIRPAQRKWIDVLDNNNEQFLGSKGLYLDGHNSVAFGPIDPSFRSEETPLPALSFSYPSPSPNSSGGPHTPLHTPPHTPKCKHAYWRETPCSSGSHVFWNETMNLFETSDVDMNDCFDDAGTRL